METIVHRGSNEVGGNCVEVRTGSTRIIIDVGMPLFGENRQPHDLGKLKRLSAAELRSVGILLEIPGLFELDRSRDETHTVAAIDAILLSHAHQDHTGLLPFTRPEIPVYGTSGTSKMMLAGSIFANQVSVPRDRYHTLDKDGKLRIGDIEITPIAVDHSIYGSVAYLLEADGERIIYSGDLRMHGRKPGMMHDLVASMKFKEIDVLLMEGTHFGFPDGQKETEYDVEAQITKLIGEAPELVLASFSPQNVDRLVAFIRAAIKTKRILVVDVYTAFVMHLIRNEIGLPQPGQDECVRIFYPKAFENSVERKRLQKISDLFIESRIEWSDVFADPSKYLMVFRPSMLRMDFENQLPKKTLCLYSRWKGYLEQPEWLDTRKAVEQSGGIIEVVHTSGHIFSEDIIGFVKSIAPKRVVPIHTFEPHLFCEQFENAWPLQDGEACDHAVVRRCLQS